MEYGIKEFSKLGQIPVKTLRQLKRTGVLVPARTDASGKEYYSDKQLDGLRKIAVMCELGMSPSEMLKALNSSDTEEAFEARRKKNDDDVVEARERLETFDRTVMAKL